MGRISKRVWVGIAVAVVFLAGLVYFWPGLPLRESREQIRQSFLKQTPIGSTTQEVVRQLRALGYEPQMTNKGYLRQAPDEPMSVIGTSSVRTELGGYCNLLLFTSVTGFWAFDADGRLIDVWIWKVTDAP